MPDRLVRHGIRRLLEDRLQRVQADLNGPIALIEQMRRSPLAIETDAANEQHYELPHEFFTIVLGPLLKYSSGYWPDGTNSLADAEAKALELTCQRAAIEDGLEVLELGCGWGSLSLWIAEHYPGCRVTAVSNSATQGDFIRQRASARSLTNVEVVTNDMRYFDTERRFDRIVSVEMFEHMRNWELLCERLGHWMQADGKLFVHVFCHRATPYFFEVEGTSDWMAKYFFSGGLMPSEHLMEELSGPLQLEQRWRLNGQHYEKTLLSWLANMDRREPEIRPVFEVVYGQEADRWFQRWRLFFLACAELFGYGTGDEWFVSHSLWVLDDQARESKED